MMYAGLVVGGPLNGERIAQRAQQYSHDGFLYQFGPIYLDHNNEVNVWTPVGQTRLDTLKLLVEGYRV